MESGSTALESGCGSAADASALSGCLRPWLDSWEVVRESSPAGHLRLPVFHFQRDQVLALCDGYIEKLDTCLSDRLVASCAESHLYKFLHQQIGYVCGPQAVEVLSQFDCISSVVRRNSDCSELIEGIPAPGLGRLEHCAGMRAYFACLEGPVLARCEARGIAILAQAIHNFGCSLGEADADVVEVDASGTSALPNSTAFLPPPDSGEEAEEAAAQAGNAPVLKETIEFESGAEVGIREFRSPEVGGGLSDGELAEIHASASTTPAFLEELSEVELDFGLAAAGGLGFELNLKRPSEPGQDISEEFLEKPADVLILPDAEIPGLQLPAEIRPDESESAEELEGSGEATEAIGRILPATAAERMAVDGACSVAHEGRIVGCYAPLSQKWDDITQRLPETQEVVFPLFSYPTTDLLALCDVLQATLDDCLDDEMLASCASHPIMHFVDGLLGFSCGRHKTDFFLTFDCIRDVEEKNAHCLDHIKGAPRSGLDPAQRCAGMGAYVGCMQTQLATTCTPDSMKMFLSAIQHFGCPIEGRIFESEPGPPVELFLKPAARKLSVDSSEFSEEELKNLGSPTKDNPHRVGAPPYGVPPPPVENSHPIISSFCTPRIKDKLRVCLRPLFGDWLRYRAITPQLNNITFPLWFYEKSQLLEMCDLYASSFLDCDFPLFDVCLTDEIVRFANNHLGYICSPSKIGGFMASFDCTANVLRNASVECLPFIRGPSEPGNDLQRCDGMASFYDCALHRVEGECGRAAVTQLQAVIRQFGCDLENPTASAVPFSRVRQLA